MKTINLIVPRGWHELDDKQLRYLFGLLADDYSRLVFFAACFYIFFDHGSMTKCCFFHHT